MFGQSEHLKEVICPTCFLVPPSSTAIPTHLSYKFKTLSLYLTLAIYLTIKKDHNSFILMATAF
jgi:hypothetical protein